MIKTDKHGYIDHYTHCNLILFASPPIIVENVFYDMHTTSIFMIKIQIFLIIKSNC